MGKLGTFEFPPGEYLYFGSALNGLEGRIRRHLRRDKRRHWHIDFLTAVSSVVGVWWTTGTERRECSLAKAALDMEGAQMPARGFGASDCRCQSHLVCLAGGPATGEEATKQPAPAPSTLSIGKDLLEWRRPPADLEIALSLWR
ncbi:MAG: hypothetical protein HW388_764 [Dehalococcoidia bacterium]|nr:hypothetical protein [Dehalococcoidia bacterium]